MTILAVDSSSGPASAALLRDGKILGEFFLHSGLTHSQTLSPLIDGLLRSAAVKLCDVDALWVTGGPGSFTGLRIGLATVKGLALGTGLPCGAVSTLEALAWNFAGLERTVWCVMDARCGQVYHAAFRTGEGVERLGGDEAISMEALFARLPEGGELPVLAGDGAELFAQYCRQRGRELSVAPPALRFQRASSVAFAGAKNGVTCSGEELELRYLRLPQAERELLLKKQKEQ